MIPKCPDSFDGKLSDLFQKWIRPVLLSCEAVEDFHIDFMEYIRTEDPIFLVRAVNNQVRRNIVRVASGCRIRPTDNSPACWIHRTLYACSHRTFGLFDNLIEAIPCHIFDISTDPQDNVNRAGWHVAHIFRVKDGNINVALWDRRELCRRFARNIHPCNYFYIPKDKWQSYGGMPVVISFFYEQYRRLYPVVWEDFLRLVEAPSPDIYPDAGDFRYIFGCRNNSTSSRTNRQEEIPSCDPNSPVTYRYSRLCFKASVIEKLHMDETFCIVTPNGSYRMTRREFQTEFQNVVRSHSYQEKGLYHYPKPPKRALQFRVGLCDGKKDT